MTTGRTANHCSAEPTDFAAEVKQAALDYSGYEPKEPREGLNLIALDQLVGFHRGANFAAFESGLVKELVEALHTGEKLARATENPSKASDHTYIKSLRMKFREQKRDALAAYDRAKREAGK